MACPELAEGIIYFRMGSPSIQICQASAVALKSCGGHGRVN